MYNDFTGLSKTSDQILEKKSPFTEVLNMQIGKDLIDKLRDLLKLRPCILYCTQEFKESLKEHLSFIDIDFDMGSDFDEKTEAALLDLETHHP